MKTNHLQISYSFDNIWACKITLKDTIAYLETLQKFLQERKKLFSTEEDAWLFCSLQVHIHCLDEELREMETNGKIEIKESK